MPAFVRLVAVGAACALAFGLVGCGGSSITPPSDPVGEALMPDLAPAPPRQVHMTRSKGRWVMSFDSSMVNIGRGPFVLRAEREDGEWRVIQDVMYSTSGGRSIPLRATMVWGGDGHNHWHIARVAINHLVPIRPGTRPVLARGLIDSKVGFCFYDYHHVRPYGPAKKTYSRHGCGHENSKAIRMGLSPGWVDTYPWVLPGQSVDVTKLKDGNYRLWAVVDEQGWFHEASGKNDVTWADIRLSTHRGLRFAEVTKVGPVPQRSS